HILAAPLASAAASLARARSGRRLSPPAGALWLSGALLVGGLAVGAFISAQGQARTAGLQSASAPITRQSDREIVAATISRLENEQVTLKKRIADLRAELSTVQRADAERKTSLLDIN